MSHRRNKAPPLSAPGPGELYRLIIRPEEVFLVTGVRYVGKPFMRSDTWRIVGLMAGEPYDIDWSEWDDGWTLLSGRNP